MEKDGYFYIEQGEMFRFFKIPHALMTEKYFEKLSIEAKLLYGLFLDRMGLSRENHWVDEKKRVYIIFKNSDIQEVLHCSAKKAIKLTQELEEFDLLEKERMGLNKANHLYVKDFTRFVTETSGSVKSDISEERISEEVDKIEEEILVKTVSKTEEDRHKVSGSANYGFSGSVGNDTSRSVNCELLDVSKATRNNNTYSNKTDYKGRHHEACDCSHCQFAKNL